MLLRLLSLEPGEHFSSIDPGIFTYKARHFLAVCYHRRQMWQPAIEQWQQVIAEQRDFILAWLGLGETSLQIQDQSLMDQTLEGLRSLPEGELQARIFQVRWLLMQKQFAQAREQAELVIQDYPEQTDGYEVLSHVLLQEGSDLAAAEVALREILKRQPGHREALNNLSVLIAQQQKNLSSAFGEHEEVTDWALDQQYQAVCHEPSDLQVHLPVLAELARDCSHITDLGTGEGRAALAFLTAQPDRLVCVDIQAHPRWEILENLKGRAQVIFQAQSSLTVDLEETDLLFLDTWLVAQQLRAELSLHAQKARRYLVIHGTETFAEQGQTEGHEGLKSVVEDLIQQGDFEVLRQDSEGLGLTVLKRASSEAEPDEAQ